VNGLVNVVVDIFSDTFVDGIVSDVFVVETIEVIVFFNAILRCHFI